MQDTRPTRRQIDRLKLRRDQLLNRACTRDERPLILEEVRAINRTIHRIERRLDGDGP